MPNWKEGDRVRIIERPVTEDDRKKSLYYEHMGGLTGLVQNVYADDEVAVKIDPAVLSAVTKDVHKNATEKMRQKFLASVSEEQKKQLTTDEINFDVHYMLLVQGKDLVKA